MAWVCDSESFCVCTWVRVRVCVALHNQHRNTRFTAPACQDSLWPQDFHHHPVHPVEKKMEPKLAQEEGKRIKKKNDWNARRGGGLHDFNKQLPKTSISFKK